MEENRSCLMKDECGVRITRPLRQYAKERWGVVARAAVFADARRHSTGSGAATNHATGARRANFGSRRLVSKWLLVRPKYLMPR